MKVFEKSGYPEYPGNKKKNKKKSEMSRDPIKFKSSY